VRIAGLPGWQFTGDGAENGRDRSYYAAILFTKEGYLIAAGNFDSAKYPDQIDAFRAMARSLEFAGR